MIMEYGTGWGRTRHILRDGKAGTKRGLCGAAIDPLATIASISIKPLCKACARQRHLRPCTRCGGTGQEPEQE